MLTGLKLLLVEDDEDDYVITRDLLEEIHPGQVEIEWVTTVASALARLAEDRHDLCLVDYRLGAEDGLQLLAAASEAEISIPLIMLTGQHDNQLDAEAQRAGAVDYLVKSELNPALLARAVRYARARREAEQERAQRQRAESENRSKSQFLAHLSHELRTPLTSIIGYSELLLSQEKDVEAIKSLRTIDRNGRHVLNLLNDVLDLSKIEAGKLDLDVCTVNLEQCLADLQSLLEVQARAKRVDLSFVADEPVPETIQTDPTRLRQILLNLLSNAIKFTEDGLVELQVSVVTDTDDAAHAIQFRVTDSGIGIAEADQRKIFEPFSQAENTPGGLGFGLGLSISQELAERLGGEINCVSELGHGSTFTLTIAAGDLKSIPRKTLELAQCADVPVPGRQIRLAGRVLVVDDLADIRRLLGRILSECGLDVTFAANGEQAVTQVLAREGNAEQFDAIIMDLQMPVLDGFSALQLMRGNGFKGPVLALTASAMRGERERCAEAGFTAYHGKPVNVEQLLGTLALYLNGSPQPIDVEDSVTPEHVAKGTVLLVEDNTDARRTIAKLIKHLGWDVITAACANDAFAQVDALLSNDAAIDKASRIDIALIDLGLPDINGYELASQLRHGKLADSRIVALSGAHPEPDRACQSGFDQHVMKPIGMQQLKHLLHR